MEATNEQKNVDKLSSSEQNFAFSEKVKPVCSELIGLRKGLVHYYALDDRNREILRTTAKTSLVNALYSDSNGEGVVISHAFPFVKRTVLKNGLTSEANFLDLTKDINYITNNLTRNNIPIEGYRGNPNMEFSAEMINLMKDAHSAVGCEVKDYLPKIIVKIQFDNGKQEDHSNTCFVKLQRVNSLVSAHEITCAIDKVFTHCPNIKRAQITMLAAFGSFEFYDNLEVQNSPHSKIGAIHLFPNANDAVTSLFRKEIFLQEQLEKERRIAKSKQQEEEDFIKAFVE